MSKTELACILSKLKTFDNPKIYLEQYPTDSEIAADVLWHAALLGDIKGKCILDLGSGSGILGIGALIMGAKQVSFIDIDEDTESLLAKNLESIKSQYELSGTTKFINKDITLVSKKDVGKIDLIVQNPPFGTKNKHIDWQFLEKAMHLSDVIYSFHKTETREYIEKKIADSGFKITHYFQFNFPIKKTMKHHKKKIERINVSCWRLVKS